MWLSLSLTLHIKLEGLILSVQRLTSWIINTNSANGLHSKRLLLGNNVSRNMFAFRIWHLKAHILIVFRPTMKGGKVYSPLCFCNVCFWQPQNHESKQKQINCCCYPKFWDTKEQTKKSLKLYYVFKHFKWGSSLLWALSIYRDDVKQAAVMRSCWREVSNFLYNH